MYCAAMALLYLEIAGFVGILSAVTRVRVAFLPPVVTSVITLVVFLGGIAQLLDAVSLVVHLLGLLALACCILVRKIRRPFLGIIVDPGFVFYSIGFLAAVVLLSNATYAHYDEFSHWGTIVKDMFSSHAFPADGSTVARIGYFVNYPPATASFIYFVDSVVGYSEGHTIVAQNILLFSGLSAMFGGVRHPQTKGTVALCAIAAVAALFVIESDLALFQSLLTDVVMGVMVSASILMVLFNREKLVVATLLASPIVIVSAFVKDNGKLYLALFMIVLLVCALLTFGVKKHGNSKKALLKSLLLCMFPAVIFIGINSLWSSHVNYAFAAGFDSGKFAVSADKLLAGPNESMITVGKRVLYEALFYNPQRIAIFWGLNVLAVGALIYGRTRSFKSEKLFSLTLIGNGAILITCLALVVLYSYFMPTGESKTELAGFTRYYGTSLLIFFCLVSRGLISWLDGARPIANKAGGSAHAFTRLSHKGLSIILGGALLASVAPGFYAFVSGRGLEHLQNSTLFSEPKYTALRQPISSVMSTSVSPIPQGSTVSVFCSQDTAGSFSYFVGLYESQCAIYLLDSTTDAEIAKADLAKSSWLVFIGEDQEEFKSYIESLGLTLPSETTGRYFTILHDENGGLELKQG